MPRKVPAGVHNKKKDIGSYKLTLEYGAFGVVVIVVLLFYALIAKEKHGDTVHVRYSDFHCITFFGFLG